MFIIGCFAIMGIIFLCLLYRLILHYRLNQIKTKQTSRLFKTQLMQFKQKELRKSFVYVFLGMMGLITVLSFAFFQLFQLETTVQGLRTNNHTLQSEVKIMKQRTNAKSLLKTYPASGLQLEKKLIVNNQTIAHKEQIEKNLSKQLLPYIEEANLVLSSGTEADALTVLLTGSVEATNANLVLLGQNISAFMKEAEEIKRISEVHINMIDREGNDLYKGTYVRNNTGQFTFQSELRKGKG